MGCASAWLMIQKNEASFLIMVQNIDLMNLADFCRNCLSKWYVAATEDQGKTIDYEQARELVYGMPYPEWKEKYQTPATPEQLAKMKQRS